MLSQPLFTESEKMGWDALFCVFEVLDGVEFAGEKVRDIEDRKGAALGDEAQESEFVEGPFPISP